MANEQPNADFSDVQGGSSSTAPQAQPQSSGGAGGRTYTVKSGDSLSKIAEREYGDAHRWHAIFEANRNQISDPNLIRPGQILVLPDLG